jgi:cytidylate kinase
LRDKQDIARSNSPLVVPKGANIIDNSGLFNNTLKKINQLIGQM